MKPSLLSEMTQFTCMAGWVGGEQDREPAICIKPESYLRNDSEEDPTCEAGMVAALLEGTTYAMGVCVCAEFLLAWDRSRWKA